MDRRKNEAVVRSFFERAREFNTKLVASLLEEENAATAVMDEAAGIFERMIPDMAYLETPEMPMAANVFVCNASLAVYLALTARGVDAHAYGRAMLAEMARSPAPDPSAEKRKDTRTREEQFADFMSSAASSQKQPKPGEFIYEVFLGDKDNFDWGMNVESCAICSSFSKYDAMDLVPYMCASDDVMSDQRKQGLRRTGTIALGAHHCDFRYKTGGEPQHIAEEYPERIRLTVI
ncbi:MAG: L-2-amino-thiazoline-4-carboxylic acid hydrolase [Gammaproteobacteria bacterium]|nr:L-2-amino-thiazoline-4-carboxylic acid hydrolase [Gammaproteobacteria bacterium]